MNSLENSFENFLSFYVSSEVGKVICISREIALEKNFSDVVNSTEKKSSFNRDVYWEKRAYSAGNVLDTVDFENRLIRRTSGTKTINISYDADGNRVSKTVSDSTSGATTTYYLIDTNNLTGYAQVVEELYNNGGNLETYRSYTYGLDLIAQHQLMPPANPTQWETSYYMYDGLGTVRALTNDNGLITDAYTYSAFGELLNTQSSGTATPNLYLFTGEQFDADLGMYFLRARYMNTTTGRFHNLDTYEGDLREPTTLHKYTYTANNPISFIDPSGNAFTIGQQLVAASVIGIVSTLAVGRIAFKQLGEDADGIPDGFMVSTRVDAAGGRFNTVAGGVDFVYDFNDSEVWAFLTGEFTFDATRVVGRPRRSRSVSAGFVWNMDSPSQVEGIGFNTVIPISMAVTFAKLLIADKQSLSSAIYYLQEIQADRRASGLSVNIGFSTSGPMFLRFEKGWSWNTDVFGLTSGNVIVGDDSFQGPGSTTSPTGIFNFL